MRRMSETYKSKRERWQRLLGGLPTILREHVSLRNVETVAALPPQAQVRLAEAIQAGLKRLPRALEQLQIDPYVPVTDLLNPPVQPLIASSPTGSQLPQNIHAELIDLLQACFPDMPRMSADALVRAEVFEMVRMAAQVHHQLFESPHLRTDFVMMVLYGLMRQSLERLEAMIEDQPALRQVFNQGSLPWKPNDWRNPNA